MKTEPAGPGALLGGLGVSPGIAIGPALVVETGMERVPEYRVPAARLKAETERLDRASQTARRQLGKLGATASAIGGAAGEELGYLLAAQVQMLSGSRLIRGARERILAQRINAEWAVRDEVSEIARGIAQADDAYLAARAADIRDVGRRLIRGLTAVPAQTLSQVPRGAVIVAEEVTPADTALMDPKRVAGFVSELGGQESHTAIMARSLGLPAVLGVAGATAKVQNGDMVIVDGDEGRLIVNPDRRTLERYRRRREARRRRQRTLARLGDVAAVTRDGVEIKLQVNVELPVELALARDVGAQGIGLLRSEFMFMNRPDLPSEDEQVATLAEIVRGMAGRPVTIRTLDLGADKLAGALGDQFGDADNPALGLRAIRLSLSVPALLETQLAAMLRVANEGPIRILLPMISTSAEVRQVRQALTKVARRLARRGLAVPDPLPPLGVMIEVPGAALAADALARDADFFSLGTNDLTMYTLAIDRANDRVAKLYDPLHPAVLRLIQFTIQAALRARIPVNLCGEMAGDPRYGALLLGLGLRDLSMVGSALPLVKQRIRKLNLTEAIRRTNTIMDQADAGRIAMILDDFNALL